MPSIVIGQSVQCANSLVHLRSITILRSLFTVQSREDYILEGEIDVYVGEED